MFTQPIFETLPIAVIAASILLMALVHHLATFGIGIALIIISCIMLYRRYTQLGTDPDVLDYLPKS